MPHVPTAAFALALAMPALLAGCFADEEQPSPDIYAVGQDVRFTTGWAYNGTGAERGQGFLVVFAKNTDNTGTTVAAVTIGGNNWTILFNRYAQQAGRDFQDGGVAFNLEEHGDTGNGDASIPHVHAEAAAWGFANVTLNNRSLPDPSTGSDTWTAHFMVLTTGVRDDTTMGIWNQAKTAPYDPAQASDGYAYPGDKEIHLVLRARNATTNGTQIEPVRGVNSNPVMYARNFVALYNNALPGTVANFTVSTGPGDTPAGSSPASNAEMTFTFRDPDGEEIIEAAASHDTVAGTDQDATVSFTLAKAGQYTVDIHGQAVASRYDVTGTVMPPTVLNFWWEDYVSAARAEDLPANFLTTPSTGGNGTASLA